VGDLAAAGLHDSAVSPLLCECARVGLGLGLGLVLRGIYTSVNCKPLLVYLVLSFIQRLLGV
jgi:hypothetical protein